MKIYCVLFFKWYNIGHYKCYWCVIGGLKHLIFKNCCMIKTRTSNCSLTQICIRLNLQNVTISLMSPEELGPPRLY